MFRNTPHLGTLGLLFIFLAFVQMSFFYTGGSAVSAKISHYLGIPGIIFSILSLFFSNKTGKILGGIGLGLIAILVLMTARAYV